MLIAIPKEGDLVCPHFGHCEEFGLYNTDTKNWVYIENPGHVPGYLPVFLKQHNVQVVIAGGMGGRAQELFAAQGIKTIVGASGTLEEVMEQYLKGKLQTTGEVCSEHQHAGHCHD